MVVGGIYSLLKATVTRDSIYLGRVFGLQLCFAGKSQSNIRINTRTKVLCYKTLKTISKFINYLKVLI